MEGYIGRWRIEETIQFVKQSYGIENLRVTTYTRIRNMASLVLAAAYFSMAWIGRAARMEILAEYLKELSKRLDERPGLSSYAIADGIWNAFVHITKWVVGKAGPLVPSADPECPPGLPSWSGILVRFGRLLAPRLRHRDGESPLHFPKHIIPFIYWG